MKNILIIAVSIFLPLSSYAQLPAKVGQAIVKQAGAKALPKVTRVPSGILRPLSLATEGHIIGGTLAPSTNKTALNLKQMYDLERNLAQELLKVTQQPNFQFNPSSTETLLSEVVNVRNASLRGFLTQSLNEQTYDTFLQDLADYYSIPVKFVSSLELRFVSTQFPSEAFAKSAVNYLMRHPHKMNLKLREIMKSPLVADSVKEILRKFVASPQLTAQQQHALHNLLRDVHEMYEESLVKARGMEALTISTYNDTYVRLQDFVARHGRVPAWHGEEQERLLFNRIWVIMQYNSSNHFAEVATYQEKIQEILEAYPQKYITLEETTQRLDAYVAEHGTVPTWPEDRSQLTYADALFLESIDHWTIADMQFRTKLSGYRNAAVNL